jgi:transcriptional regulator of acetoin/glycerol metabolism
MSARMIENYWFCDHFSRQLRLHFQLRPELIGTLAEGVMALDAEGRILGVNRAGLQLLGCSGAALRIQGLRMLFGLSSAS